MASSRVVRACFQKFVPTRLNLLLNNTQLTKIHVNNINQERSIKNYARFLRVMKLRRKVAGPERVRRRNEWGNWNYKAELYAFSQRLHEKISEDTLRCAFVNESFVEMEEKKRKSLDIPVQDVQLDIKSNSSFITLGSEITSNYLNKFLRASFELIPEEGIQALHDFLTSDTVLSHISYNIGTSDLIFSAEYPPGKSTLSATLKAIIGGIATDNSVSQAELFVLDFICPQLIGKDIFEIWHLDKPLIILDNILNKQGREQTESRLIFESGRNTIEAIYIVGLYSGKLFMGRGYGETPIIAEEMAAYDSLRRIFRLNESEKPVPLGLKAKGTDFVSRNSELKLCDWTSELAIKS